MLLLAASTDHRSSTDAWWLGFLVAIGAGVFVWAKKRNEGIDQPSLIYALVPIPYFAFFTWMAVILWSGEAKSSSAFDFLMLQIVALILGIAHVVMFYREVAGWRALSWPKRTRDWSWPHFGYTLLLMLSGMVGIMVADVLPFTGVDEGWDYFTALLTFLVPFLWVKAFDVYLAIPVAEYRPWYPTLEFFNYEPHEKFPKVTVRVFFEERNSGRIEHVPFDPNKPFEHVYRWVLHIYLQDQPETYYSERDNATYVWGWHFHRERTSWLRWNKRIDPERSFLQGKLRDGDTVIALRDPKLEHLETVREEMRQRVRNSKP